MSSEGTAPVTTARASVVTFPPEPVSGFHVVTQMVGEGICSLECSGQLDSKDPTTELQPQLLAFHEDLVKKGVKQVKLDVSGMQYMNSSAIKCFMTWFLKVQRAEGPYEIEILYDAKKTWQYVSFTTMGRIAPRVLKTAIKAPAAE